MQVHFQTLNVKRSKDQSRTSTTLQANAGGNTSRFPAFCIIYAEILQASSDEAPAHRTAFTDAFKFRSFERSVRHVRGELKHTVRCQVGLYTLHNYSCVPVITQ